ncbi:MAG: patatin-like phospholipase family protein [Alphaproteobacteria bacterium]|jgi:NTE family protein|nr:patatin-like phospholipase family protein [Alphaproteobacteria bacterium]
MKPSLAQAPFLAGAPEDLLAAVTEASAWFSVPAGCPLFLAGETSEAMYFLMSGSLAAFRAKQGQEPALLGYIRPGEPVGEMSLIAGEPHSADVYAIRDSELLRVDRDQFERLAQNHPGLMERIARLMLSRARAEPGRSPRAQPKIFALFSSSPTIDLRLRAKALQAAIQDLGRRCVIVGEEGAAFTSAWFDALERENDIVLLFTPIADTTWFRIVLRQADRMWVLARGDALPSIPLFPDEGASPAQRFRLVDLVVLHHGMDRKAASTEVWRAACDATRVFHWRGVEGPDCQRMARVMTAAAIALVLSGGGARAYAQIGVIRAFREAGAAFDLVGGTSMGAVIAACYAKGWNDEEIEVRIRRAFVESNPLGDYTLPVVAFSRGGRVDDRLQEHFGESLIEDLTVPFFCISTDLAAARPRVHRSGLLRRALRASISLPGVLPPVVDEDGGLLVDGAVLNNFPVDVAQSLHRGPIVGVDVARQLTITPEDFKDPPGFFSWVAAHGLQTAPPVASLLMRAATLAVDPWIGRKQTDILILPEMADIDLQDWKRFDDAVAAGYEAATAALASSQDGLLPGQASPYAAGASRAVEAVE